MESLFNKDVGLKVWNLLRIYSSMVFSCEICENFKNTIFYRIPPVAAWEQYEVIGWEDFIYKINFCPNF